MSAAMQGVPSSWPGFKELLLSNSISKTPFKTFRKWTQDAGWDLSHNKGKPDVCTLSERDRRKAEERSRRVSSSRGMREGLAWEGLVLWGSRQEQGTASLLGHILSTREGFPVYREHCTWENSLSIKVKGQKGKISLMLFLLLLHIKPWWILRGCFLSWILYLQNKALSERMSRSQTTVAFILIF